MDARAGVASFVGAPGAEAGPALESGGRAVRQLRAGGDHVHHAPDRVRPVEQGRRSAHDLDPLRLGGIGDRSLLGRLAADVAGAHPVFGDQHPVAIEPADDGTRSPGTETADRHAGGAFEQLGQAGHALDQFEALEGGRRPELRQSRRFAGGRGHRHVFVGGSAKRDPDRVREDDLGTGIGIQRQAGFAPQESEVGVDRDPGSDAHPFEREPAVRVGGGRRARFAERYLGAPCRIPGGVHEDLTGDPRLGGRGGRDERARQDEAGGASGRHGSISGGSAR